MDKVKYLFKTYGMELLGYIKLEDDINIGIAQKDGEYYMVSDKWCDCSRSECQSDARDIIKKLIPEPVTKYPSALSDEELERSLKISLADLGEDKYDSISNQYLFEKVLKVHIGNPKEVIIDSKRIEVWYEEKVNEDGSKERSYIIFIKPRKFKWGYNKGQKNAIDRAKQFKRRIVSIIIRINGSYHEIKK